MNFVRRSGITLVARVGIFLFAVGNSILLARLYGPQGKGMFALLTVVPMLTVQGLSLGLALANAYFVGRGRATAKELAENGLVFALGMGGFAALAYLWLRPWLDPLLFRGISPTWSGVVMAALPLLFLWYVFNNLSLALHHIVEFNLPNLLRPALLFVGLLLFWKLLNHSFAAAVLAWWVSVLVMAGAAVFFVRRRLPFGLHVHPRLLRDTLRFGIQGYLGTLLQLLYLRVDYILLNLYRSNAEVGFYSIAVLIAEMLWFFPNTVAAVLLPEVAHASEADSNRLTLQLCRNTLVVSVAAAAVLALVARPLIDIAFTPAFRPAIAALWLLLPGVAAASIGKILASYLVGRGQPLLSTTAAAVTLAANLAFNFWLIPRWGAGGAALASSVSYVIGTVVYVAALQRLSGASLRQALVVQRQDWAFYRTLWVRMRGD